ncbi:MAG: Ig-like domain-containing protein [archaeon]|nr:Ig-like domain-containing protein [archaeon]MCP8320088.1 Ig-like domain-containing protein [archaeon]
MSKNLRKAISIAIISLFILSVFASVQLALAVPTLTLNPTSGPSGTVVTVTGSGFTAGSYRVYFDTNGNSAWNSGEPYKTVFAVAGTFSTTLTVPSVASGLYYIRADVWPYTSPATASAPFTVIPPYTPEVTNVDVTASPTTVYADGVDASTITATVKDQYGIPMQGVTVDFTTTFGTLSSSSAVTNAFGKASVTITSEYIGIATVTATADSISDSVDVEFIGVGGIGDILLKLLDIKTEVEDVRSKLITIDNVVDSILDELTTDIATAGATWGWTDLASALADIKSELEGWFGTGGTYSETTQIETMGGRFISTTLVPPITLSTSGTGVNVEWSTDQAHSGSYSAKMTIQAGSGDDDNGGRIVVNVWDLNKKLTDIDPSTTLEGQLKHSFWAFQPTPFLTDFPYFRIRLDTDGDPSTFEVMLVAMGTHTLRPDQELPADAPTGQWIQLTEIGGGEIVEGIGYVEGTQYWRPVPYTAFEYHVLQYWQNMYPDARIIDVAVICGFWGTPRTETVSIYIDDVNILGYTFNLEPEPAVSIAKAVASETAQFTVTLSVDVTDVGDIAIVKATFDGTNWVALEDLTTDGYKTITIAARGVEILYYDASPYNMIIDWGITVIAKPDVTITWT